MKNKNEKGFALVLSLILMIVMSLMGGALIIISAGDHASNNESDNYQQTFYVAETGLLEGERALLNEFMGPLKSDGSGRDRMLYIFNKQDIQKNLTNQKKPKLSYYHPRKNYLDSFRVKLRKLNSFKRLVIFIKLLKY